MKIPISILLFLALVVNSLEAQSVATQGQTAQTQVTVPAPTPYTIVNQDANSQVWQRQVYEAGPNGQTVTHIQQYQEIASGLNYKDANSNWQPAKEEIDIQPDGTAASTQGQHKVYFPIDISNGRIILTTPDGLQVSSEPLELSYWDGTNTVVLAELTNSVGVLVGNNEVVYPNAFAGLKADLKYVYTRAGLEQDVILRQQPLTPEYYNLNPASARIQMVSEFFNSPNPTTSTTILPEQAGITLADQSIGFGQMQMVLGRAFLLGQSATDPGAMVAKSWLVINGMQFLVEEIPVNAISDGLASLPLTAMNGSPSKAHYLASRRVVLPRHKPERTSGHKIMFSKGRIPSTGFVLDYQTVNSTMTNTTWQGDTTYYVSGSVYSFGKNVFEGGTVIKYTNSGAIYINPGSGTPSITFGGSSYRPIEFTSKDDNSVGVVISGSTGTPSGYYGTMLDLAGFSPAAALTNFRMSYANNGMIFGGVGANIYNAQFIQCFNALNLDGATLGLRNALFANNATNFLFVAGVTVDAQNSTFSGSSYVVVGPSTSEGVTLALTNCILCNNSYLTNGVLTLNGAYNGFYNSKEFGSGITTNNFYPFQTVGAGGYYFTNGCAFTNAGTVNIDPTLLAELGQKTVYPPLVYSNVVITNALTLVPLVTRDTNGNPALGYHYDSLDYVFGGCDLYTNLSISAGTAVGWFMNQGGVSSSGQPYGISMNSGSSFTTIGTATAPCWMAEYNNVQEGSVAWNNSGWMGAIMLNGDGSGTTPQINCTFTKWGPPASTLFIRDNWDFGAASFADCEFYAGYIATYDTSSLYFTNCLFDRHAIFCYDQDTTPIFTMLNCTFHDGNLVLVRYSGLGTPLWTIENTSFDGTAFATYDYLNGNNTYTLFNYNAYNTNNLSWQSYPEPYVAPTNALEVIGPNDQMVTNFNWQTSWFGSYYLPTNSPIIQMGSTNANLLGLYHFTTQINQAIEGNSIVDIGYHYVATDGSGNPLDSNGDGIPDYTDDANGNGIIDPGELPFGITIENPNNGAVLY